MNPQSVKPNKAKSTENTLKAVDRDSSLLHGLFLFSLKEKIFGEKGPDGERKPENNHRKPSSTI